jgi:hypothetical protein
VAHAAFAIYREQAPPRSIRKAARALGRGQRTLEEWSSKYKWVDRAAAYTDHLDQLALAALEDNIVRRRREANEQVYQLARAMRGMVHARTFGVTDDEGKQLVAPLDPNVLGPSDLVRLFESSTKAIRLALGLPLDLTGPTQVSLKTVEVILADFVRLAEKRMDPAAHEALLRDCYASVHEQLGY